MENYALVKYLCCAGKKRKGAEGEKVTREEK